MNTPQQQQPFSCTTPRLTRPDQPHTTLPTTTATTAHQRDSLIHLMTLPHGRPLTTLPPLSMPSLPGTRQGGGGGTFKREDLLKVLQEAEAIMEDDDFSLPGWHSSSFLARAPNGLP